jgi:hypothetical protein
MTNSLEEGFEDSGHPALPPINVTSMLAGIQGHLKSTDREARLVAAAILAHALLVDDPGQAPDLLAEDATTLMRAIDRQI